MIEEEWECLISVLESYLRLKEKSEAYTEESIKYMYKKLREVIVKLLHSKRYDAALEFYLKSKVTLTYVFEGHEEYYHWKKLEVYIRLKVGDYEIARQIYDDCEHRDKIKSKTAFDLYNEAIYYTCFAEHKEKEDKCWKQYIEKAYEKIKESEDALKEDDKFLLGQILFEKSFILSEKEEYEKACEYLKEALENSDDEIKTESNFNTHLWVLMKYLSLNFEKFGTVKQIIEDLYKDYGYKIPQCYREIISFMHSEMEKLQHEIEYNQIYINLS